MPRSALVRLSRPGGVRGGCYALAARDGYAGCGEHVVLEAGAAVHRLGHPSVEGAPSGPENADNADGYL
jgi:hypothetical protein